MPVLFMYIIPSAKATDGTGWLVSSLVVLSLFSILVLMSPPQPVSIILELMPLPLRARTALLLAAGLNVVLSLAFEEWGTRVVALVFGWLLELRRGGKRRVREGKAYKAVEGGMR